MRTAGIDLSTRQRKTAVAIIDWGQSSAEVVELSVSGHDVPALRRVVEDVDKTGIDCPFGWPNDFVSIVSAHRTGGPVHVRAVPPRGWLPRPASSRSRSSIRS